MSHVSIEPSSWACFASDTFAGQVAVVTGAGGGMGATIVQAFADLGVARVWVTDVDEAAARQVATQVGSAATPAVLDVADAEAVARLFERIDAEDGRVDHVVTCAAIITANKTPQVTRDQWQRVFDINLWGTFTVCQQALARMAAQGAGHVVCIGSDAGKQGGGGLIADAPYAASKAGDLSLVKSLAREYAGRGVRINALVPGPTDTPMHATIPQELKERIAANLPVRRMGDPRDMAAAVMFLCSPAARFIYGASINVDGGALFE